MVDLALELQAPNLTDRKPIRPGDPAPDLSLPLIAEDRVVSLADYRGRRALFLAIERGLFCPFCRRHIAHLGLTRGKLDALGVDVLTVVGTRLDRARTYVAGRPMPVPMAADPMHQAHRAFGLPRFAFTPETDARMSDARIDPFGDLPAPRRMKDLAGELERADPPYEWTAADQQAFDAGQLVLTGQFLVDRDGIVRWANVEGGRDGLAGLAGFPSEKEILSAARTIL
jgi:peroxiredoxin